MSEERLPGGIRMETGGSFPLGTDSMVLADFAAFSPGSRVADLGCGCGTLGLLLLAGEPSLRVTGVELDGAAARLARENAARSALEGRLSVVEGDLRAYRTLLPANGFDGAIANPPYYPEGSGRVSERHPGARGERTCPLPELCRCAAWLLRFGGSFFIVHKPERLADLVFTLRLCRLEPKRLRLVRHHPGANASLVLMEARLGGRPGLRLENDLFLFDPDGSESAEYRRIYHLSGGST
jgi:tRNA1Val (adenine37-N6)-methyltransferase